MKDFELYTGIKIDSSRVAHYPNGSQIMFRHLEELNKANLQNINLGFALLEQGEELETDDVFWMLNGRLRRAGVPHWLAVIANQNGHNWIYDLWKLGKLENASLSEMSTLDNADVLPVDFIESLEQIKKNKPEIYSRFVLNSWDEVADAYSVIPAPLVREAVNSRLYRPPVEKRLTVVDPAEEGDDEAVIYNMVNTAIESQEIVLKSDLMALVGRTQANAMKHRSRLVCVDKIGIGAGVYARLDEIYQEAASDVIVYGFDGRISPPAGLDGITYGNYRAYAWFKAARYFQEHQACIPNDEVLISQLSGVKWRYSSGLKIFLELKEKTRERLKCSPDRADNYVMGLDALDQCPASEEQYRTSNLVSVHPAYAGPSRRVVNVPGMTEKEYWQRQGRHR